MAILAFQKPDKVIMIESDNKVGKFEFRPLEPGYGITIGNALRRILLSSLEGYAITTVKIEGVDHEFSTIKGVIEDVTDIILNLKQVRFKNEGEDYDTEKVTVSISGQEEFTAGDMNKFMTGFRVLNPELVICRMEPDVKIQMEITINKGRGYIPAVENKQEDVEFGVIAIDSIYTPIKKVQYAVENFRVEQKTDFEQLVLEVLRAGRDQDLEARLQRGHEVGEGLAGAGPGLDDERAPVFERVSDGGRHFLLIAAGIEAIEGAGQRPAGAEEVGNIVHRSSIMHGFTHPPEKGRNGHDEQGIARVG